MTACYEHRVIILETHRLETAGGTGFNFSSGDEWYVLKIIEQPQVINQSRRGGSMFRSERVLIIMEREIQT